MDGQGNVYVTEFSARSLYNTQPGNRVCKFDREGRFLFAWGGSGNGDGQFSKAAAIAVDDQGNVYVSELGGTEHRIQEFRQQLTSTMQFPVGTVRDHADNRRTATTRFWFTRQISRRL